MKDRASVDEIQKAIEQFTEGLPEVEQKQYEQVLAMLKDLSLDSDGHIKFTTENLKIISKVRNKLASVIDLPIYQDKIIELSASLARINELQTKYYVQTFKSFTKPKTVQKIQSLAFDSTVDQLAGSGVNESVVNITADIVEQRIREGASFHTMVDELRVAMVGNKKVEPRLISYAKQVVNDTLSGFARNYHAIVTNDLDLEWFVYLGALRKSSRPMCIALVAKKYIHKSELAEIARGYLDGVFIGTEGFMPNTTGENFLFRCCGWNCEHQAIPVPTSVVPEEIRKKYEKAVKK